MRKGIAAFFIMILAVLVLIAIDSAGFTCGNGIVEGRFPDTGFEECDDGNSESGDGCSDSCMVEFPERIYVAPYMGNIDGHFTEDWLFFYGQLVDFFDSERIPVGATTYPATLDIPKFRPYIERIYRSPYMEIVQKGFTGLGEEQYMDNLSYEEQKEIISNGRDAFREWMTEIMDVPESQVMVPQAYNQPQGRFTNDTRKALEDLGFRMFFEMYMNDDLGPVESTSDFDVLQYGVGITTDGGAGVDTEFFQPGEILIQIRDFLREDLNMLYINGYRVVPLWVHQMDFESKEKLSTVDELKWEQYTYTMKRIKDEPNLVFVSPSDIWDLRH